MVFSSGPVGYCESWLDRECQILRKLNPLNQFELFAKDDMNKSNANVFYLLEAGHFVNIGGVSIGHLLRSISYATADPGSKERIGHRGVLGAFP